MIIAALLLMQVPSYYDMPRLNRENVQRCRVASLKLHEFVGNYHSFVTSHEKDNYGNLDTEEAVVYRAMADNVARPYFDEIRFLMDRPSPDGARCEALFQQGKQAVVDEVVGPVFGDYYGYYRGTDGHWRKSPR